MPSIIANRPLTDTQIVLGSSSIYRRQLLERLGLPFDCARPDIDESPLANETPADTALRLALAKARAIAVKFPLALIIGSDQVACIGLQRFDKPGTLARAKAQLQAMSSKIIHFDTALCLLNAQSGRYALEVVTTEVRMRTLSEAEIDRYLAHEDVLDCAGSAKSEGLGISLMDYMRSDDPNALIGLPLIALCRMLRAEGVVIP